MTDDYVTNFNNDFLMTHNWLVKTVKLSMQCLICRSVSVRLDFLFRILDLLGAPTPLHFLQTEQYVITLPCLSHLIPPAHESTLGHTIGELLQLCGNIFFYFHAFFKITVLSLSIFNRNKMSCILCIKALFKTHVLISGIGKKLRGLTNFSHWYRPSLYAIFQKLNWIGNSLIFL